MTDNELRQLPPFPVDTATLDLLWDALNPGPEAESSSVWPLLTMLSQMGGSDTTAVSEVVDDGSDGGAPIVVMRDQHYHDHDVLAALITEVRNLRTERYFAEKLIKAVKLWRASYPRAGSNATFLAERWDEYDAVRAGRDPWLGRGHS